MNCPFGAGEPRGWTGLSISLVHDAAEVRRPGLAGGGLGKKGWRMSGDVHWSGVRYKLPHTVQPA